MPHANGDLGIQVIGWSYEYIKPAPYYLSRCDKCRQDFRSDTRKNMNMTMRHHAFMCHGPVIPRPEPLPILQVENEEPPF
jgi:hypothetical protein